ncbi:hypothetical protein DM860_018273 [Cuscuta australis]|uniref:Reverse transcriptase zinc-binding domain-containing protein n=1 Tax=Cuscuta australis TaxID=267555 RepID=A0A328E6D7_9ASTE|nr:hypothetical protein DM860_018273 [Cuscuta australis]
MQGSEDYSTEKGYEWLLGVKEKPEWVSFVWNKQTIPKHQMILWLICRSRISKKTRLKRFLDIDRTCDLCGQEDEDIDHLFCRCQVTQKLTR